MAETIKIKVEVDADQSVNSLNSLEKELVDLKTQIGAVDVGSKAFNDLSKQIINTESKVKNLNKSFEGLDTEALTGEFGKFTGGVSAAVTGIAALGGEANKSMEAMLKTVAKGAAIAQGFRGATEALTSAQRIYNQVLKANPIGLLITAIGVVIGAITLLITQGDKIKTMITGWAEKFTFLEGPVNNIKSAIDGLTSAWEWLQKAVLGDEAFEEKQKKKLDKRLANESEYLAKYYEAVGGNEAQVLALKLQSAEKELSLLEYGTNAYKEQLLVKLAAERDYNKFKEEEKQNELDKEVEHAEALAEQKKEFIEAAEEARIEQIEYNDEKQQEQWEKELDEEAEHAADVLEAEIDATKRKNKAIKDLDQAAFENKMAIADAVAGLSHQLAGLFKEDTIAHKAFAIATIAIDTAIGIIKAMAKNPLPSPIGVLSSIAMGVAGAAAAIKVAGIQFAKGGVLNGPSHAQGGILTPFGELEGGEGVINNISMSNPSLRNLASIANTAGGGNDFSVGDGSVTLSQESIAQIVNGYNDKKVYVSETDITETQLRVAVIEDNSYL